MPFGLHIRIHIWTHIPVYVWYITHNKQIVDMTNCQLILWRTGSHLPFSEVLVYLEVPKNSHDHILPSATKSECHVCLIRQEGELSQTNGREFWSLCTRFISHPRLYIPYSRIFFSLCLTWQHKSAPPDPWTRLMSLSCQAGSHLEKRNFPPK